ncbi:transcript variant X4 [Nothobranchius furzeri]|uniref:Transcript variant X4 n=1 Tax=Nothobranchius furzeri TaxID=105023 RepID=A0A9D2Y9C4_NOTFU|nr:transcript variant X4 [Nothobranchius furzeri]
MSAPEPTERRRSSSNMKLPLHHVGDLNGNAFPVSSSSSSSSSCLGESSPESLRSLSSLSGRCADSPLDCELLEVTLITSISKTQRTTDVVLSQWQPEEAGPQRDDDDDDDDDNSVGGIPTESIDTSVSVYLDASSGIYIHDTWRDHLTSSLNSNSGCHGNSEDVDSGSSVTRRCSSSNPDSDATETPADDDDDNEEVLFLSVSSDMCVTLTQVNTGVLPAGAESVVDDKNSVTDSVGPQIPLDVPRDLRGSSQMFSSTCSTKAPGGDASAVPPPPTPLPSAPPDEAEIHKLQTKPVPTPKQAAVPPSSLEAKRFNKLDLRPAQTKTGLRSNTSPAKTPFQIKPAPVGRRNSISRMVQGDGNKKPGPLKVAVLKPIRTKSPNPKTSHKMAATSNLANQQNRKLTISRISSDGSQGSEVEGEGPPNAPKMAVEEVPKDPDIKSPGGASVLKGSPAGSVMVRTFLSETSVRRTKCFEAFSPLKEQKHPHKELKHQRSIYSDFYLFIFYLIGSDEIRISWFGVTTDFLRSSCVPGISRPRPSPDQPSAPSPTGSAFKPAANQQPAPGSAGRSAASSRLPVKVLTSSGSGSGPPESNAASKAAPEPPNGPKPDERPSRTTLPPAKHPGSGSTAPPSSTSPPTEPSPSAPKPPTARTRTLSLQARTPAAGLKTPTASVRSPCSPLKATPPGFPKTTAPLQRFGRPNGSVDKNRTREVPARPSSISSPVAAGHQQNQHLHPAESVPDVLNANIPVKPAVSEPGPDAASTTSSGPTSSGFKTRTGSRSSPKAGPRLQNASRPGVGAAEGTAGSKQNQNKEQLEKKNQAIVQLRKILVQGNRKVEALAVIIQQLFTEREETLKKKKELSLELGTLRDELVASSQKCERLQREKEETCSSLEESLKRLEVQHQEELVQLEDRLKSFYQTEWDKVHQVYQEEADRCRTLMEQQVEDLRVRQEAEKKNQEEIHSQKMESLKRDYETSLQELKRIRQTDLEDLQKTMKETEASLSEKISELSAEREDLSEKLRAEEERRQRILSDRNLKDSHTVYLQQELESLKVVLEMKNNQLHQKEKKLMEMDRLVGIRTSDPSDQIPDGLFTRVFVFQVETNVRLEECLKKVQQENEDYRARMDKHAALSKQLSTEQALLQQTLQKESKVNKRLSMENEELLWKLHNGDLMASPRRLSPTSPFGSPRNSASFPTAAPLSPR